MGMYDDITVRVPLPDGNPITAFQTKSLGCTLDAYELRADGTLWHEDYDIEDRSDPNATGIFRLAGMLTRINRRWVQVTDFTGEIELHRWDAESKTMQRYSVYLVGGRLQVGPIQLVDKT